MCRQLPAALVGVCVCVGSYRLHWWVFVPHQKLRKAAEVTLFGEQTVESRLFLAVCYWPEEHHRVVVYGCR